MLRNYLKTALRFMYRNPVQTFIQITGMSIGLTVFLLLVLWIHNQLSFDRFNEHFHNICRLEMVVKNTEGRATQSGAMGPLMKEKIPEVIEMVRFRGFQEWTSLTYKPEGDTGREITVDAKPISADSTIFDVFSIEFISGNPKKALIAPNSIVITETLANKLFDQENPLGLIVDNDQVTGVIKDIKNSHLQFDAISSLITLEHTYRDNQGLELEDIWAHPTYLLLAEGYNLNEVEEKVNRVAKEWFVYKFPDQDVPEFKMILRPMKEVYFHEAMEIEDVRTIHGNRNMVYTFSAIAVFVLLLACINFINLSMAKSTLRAKEVGIRKVAGSSVKNLVFQFIGEIMLFILVSFLIAVILVLLFLPSFNNLVQVSLDFSILKHPQTWLITLLGIIVLTGFSGILPAISLSSFQPVIVLKGLKEGTWKRGVIFRRALLVIQFTVSIVLMIGTLTVVKQLYYMKNADPGFSSERVVFFGFGPMMFQTTENQFREKAEMVRQRFINHPDILEASHCYGIPGSHMQYRGILEFNGMSEEVSYRSIDPFYLNLLEIPVIAGRSFLEGNEGDHADSSDTNIRILLNEKAVDLFGLEKPVGTTGKSFNTTYEIIGVVKDFHFQSLKEQITPSYFIWNDWHYFMMLKLRGADMSSTMDFVEEVMNTSVLIRNYNFTYQFLDETLRMQYQSEEHFLKLIGYFTVLAIIIACLGLYGLSSFMSTRRTKEMGIRKVNGASVFTIFYLLSTDFLKWILLSFILATPVAIHAMNRWLQDFAHRTNLGVLVFIITVLLVLLIVIMTVSWQSLKTARINPVESLRYE